MANWRMHMTVRLDTPQCKGPKKRPILKRLGWVQTAEQDKLLDFPH